jgi:hypothetical protein
MPPRTSAPHAPPRPAILGWVARAAAIALALFLALFAFDVWEGDAGLGSKLLAFTIHLLPTWLCLAGVLVAWRREWLGAVVFTALALAYAWWAREHPTWILVISGPLALVAALYALAWRRRIPPAVAPQ